MNEKDELPSERAKRKLSKASNLYGSAKARVAEFTRKLKRAEEQMAKWDKKATLYGKRINGGYYGPKDIAHKMRRALKNGLPEEVKHPTPEEIAEQAMTNHPKQVLVSGECALGYHGSCDGRRRGSLGTRPCHCSCGHDARKKVRKEKEMEGAGDEAQE